MSKISNAFFDLEVNPRAGTFSFNHGEIPFLRVQQSQFGLSFWRQNQRIEIPGHQLDLLEVQEGLNEQTANGPLDFLRLVYRDGSGSLELQVEFGLLQDHPLLLQRMRLTNLGIAPMEVERLLLADFLPGSISLAEKQPEAFSFYNNGWQSWSPSGAYLAHERQQRTRLGPLANPMITNPGTPLTRRKGHFSSDMFALLCDLGSRQALVVGFLSQKEQFGSLEADLNGQPSLRIWANGDRAQLEPGQSMQTDWLSYSYAELRGALPMRNYLLAVNRENEIKLPSSPPIGWCSWYYYFTQIDEVIIRENLAQVSALRGDLPLGLLQIDDGYQEDVGTWLSFNPGFPHGVRALAGEIKSAGLEAGIWLAPYILEARSKIKKQHPDWLLRQPNGRLANAGIGWGNLLCHALDLTNPEALEYTREVVHTAVHDWGFNYLKLDFLYAAAVNCRYQDPSFTRAQVLRRGLELVREAAGEKVQLLGCGCPIGSALGLMDLMRISADVAPDWHPRFPPFSPILRQEPNMPSVRNALQNILTRSELDQHWFGNDPDCLMVRPDSRLSLPEVQTLASAIGITGGAMLLSDRLSKLPKDRLRLAQQFMPVIPGNPQVMDRFERRLSRRVRHDLVDAQGAFSLVCLINWEDSPQDLRFDPAEFGFDPSKKWIGREFWSGEWLLLDGAHTFKQVPAHGCRLLTLRQLSVGSQYLGSDLHFSQGYELKSWSCEGGEIALTLDLGHRMQGEIYLRLEKPPADIAAAEQTLRARLLQENIYAIQVELENRLEIHIKVQD